MFIVLEGLDGCGKSTQCKMLVDYLKSKEVDACYEFEPTEDILGSILRASIEDEIDIDVNTKSLLFAADRMDHLYKEGGIKDMLHNGKTIVCDRYMYSNYAYQMTEGVNLDTLINYNTKAIIPNLVFFIDTCPDICISRKSNDYYEKLALLQKVYSNYEYLLTRFKMIRIKDGTIESIHKSIVNHYEKFKGENKNATTDS